jgi:hypothetical protein
LEKDTALNNLQENNSGAFNIEDIINKDQNDDEDNIYLAEYLQESPG